MNELEGNFSVLSIIRPSRDEKLAENLRRSVMKRTLTLGKSLTSCGKEAPQIPVVEKLTTVTEVGIHTPLLNVSGNSPAFVLLLFAWCSHLSSYTSAPLHPLDLVVLFI